MGDYTKPLCLSKGHQGEEVLAELVESYGEKVEK